MRAFTSAGKPPARCRLPVLLVLCAAMAHATIAAPDEPSAEERLVRFLAGSELLGAATGLSDGERKAYLDGLAEITGLTPRTASARVSYYRSRPSQWTQVVRKVRETLESLALE